MVAPIHSGAADACCHAGLCRLHVPQKQFTILISGFSALAQLYDAIYSELVSAFPVQLHFDSKREKGACRNHDLANIHGWDAFVWRRLI